MIKYITGDIMASPAEAIVNTVNTVGVMGKGIALQFKEAFPKNFAIYVEACRKGELEPGKLLITKERNAAGNVKFIINFPTKKHWRHSSRYEYIESGLATLVEIIKANNIKSIAIPPLGCGNGGLNWDIVKKMIESALSDIAVDVSVYEPCQKIKHLLQEQSENKKIRLTPARGLLTYAMFYYDSLGENCSLFVANKLAYFLQRQGARSYAKLRFKPHHYGPYSPQVAHIIYGLNGSFIKGFEQMTAAAFEPLIMQYDRIQEISTYVRTLEDVEQQSLKETINLISGFESPLALEILASVDFIRRENPGISLTDTILYIHQWSERKNKLFKDEYIQIAYEHLNSFEKESRFLF